jgi:hypothetical protein
MTMGFDHLLQQCTGTRSHLLMSNGNQMGMVIPLDICSISS